MDLVRPLGLAGIDCAVVAKPQARARYSRFVQAVIEWADPWPDPEELVSRLTAFGADSPEPPVLYYGTDWDLLMVSRHRERLARTFRFVIPDADLVEQLVDKDRFAALATELELPVPRSRRVAAGGPAADLDLRYPLIVKPITRQIATWSAAAGDGKGVRVNDSASLRHLLDRLADAGVDVLVQELIAGPETRIESYHAYVDETGAVAGDFTGRKIRTYPREHGYSTAVEITAEADVAELGRDVLGAIGLRGVAKLDFKRDAGGALHLLEINPRFNLWHYPGALAGVNIPALTFADAAGLPRPASGAARAGVRWCHVARDARARRDEGISLVPWLRWVGSCEAKSGLAIDDLGPTFRGTAARTAERAAQALASRAPKLSGADRPTA
jgi:predicted ATP-grasp superfamily ATP-dependent carboligase